MNILGRFCLSRGCSPCLARLCPMDVPLAHHLASFSNTQRFPLAAFWQNPGESGSEWR